MKIEGTVITYHVTFYVGLSNKMTFIYTIIQLSLVNGRNRVFDGS